MFQDIVIEVGAYGVNCHLLVCPRTKEAVLIDPGEEAWRIKDHLPEGLKLTQIWLTHAHLDHIAAVNEIKALTQAKVYLHPEDKWLAENAVEQARWLGLPPTGYEPVKADQDIKTSDVMRFSDYEFSVLHVPGHSPGSVAFFYAGKGPGETPQVYSGDVLFSGSVGRTDLWKGDMTILLSSIRKKLFTLPDNTVVWPGHGPDTTIGQEKKFNPFLT